MNSALLFALSPWLVFAFASRSGGLTLAPTALLASVWSAGIVLRSLKRAQVRAFEISTLGLFSIMAVLGYMLPQAWVDNVNPYSRAIAVFGLGVLALSSLCLRPFTAQYMRDLVPHDQLSRPAFSRANIALTLAWSITALIMALSFWMGGWVSGPLLATGFNWLLPLLLILACVRYTASRWYDEEGDGELITAGFDGALSPLDDGEFGPDPALRHRPHLRLLVARVRGGPPSVVAGRDS